MAPYKIGTMLGSREEMRKKAVLLPSKSLQPGGNQISKRQLQEGVQVLGSDYLLTGYHGSPEARLALKIREGFSEEVIYKWASES